jgi:hypothetical protein
MALTCSKVFGEREGHNVQQLTISGFLNRNNFLSEPKKKITGKISGIQALLDTVSPHFKPKFNVATSTDSMNWVQYNTSDRNFVFDTLMHTYIPNSYVGSAICANGEFRVKDLKKEIREKSSKPDWLISNSDKDKGALRFNGNYQVQSMHGYINNVATYGYDMNWFTPETGATGSNTQKAEVVLALAKEISKKADVEKRYFGTQMQNQNVHENFWRAYQQNLVGLLALSTVKLALPMSETYCLIRPLDLVMFKDTSISSPDISNEYFSGIYLVSQVKKGISGMKASMTVEICREAFNGVKNAS